MSRKVIVKFHHFVPNFGEIQGVPEGKRVSKKKVFADKSGLNYRKECLNNFQICPNSSR